MSDPSDAAWRVENLIVPPHGYPNLYLHPTRIDQAFSGMIGSIDEFTRSRSGIGGANAEFGVNIGIANLKVGAKGEGSSGIATNSHLSDPVSQVLVLREYLRIRNWLASDIKSAQEQDFVLLHGKGAVVTKMEKNVLNGMPDWVPDGVAQEVTSYYWRRLDSKPDKDPEYFPVFASLGDWVAVAFAGAREMDGGQRAYIQGKTTPRQAFIFGHKDEDRNGWTLIQPLHIWFEPYKSKAT